PPWSGSPLLLPPTIHDGIAINMVSGGVFTAVSINGATNMVGFDARRVSFTSSQIQVDWADLSFDRNTIVKLDVSATAVAAPEPTQLTPMALVLAALMFWRLRY